MNARTTTNGRGVSEGGHERIVFERGRVPGWPRQESRESIFDHVNPIRARSIELQAAMHGHNDAGICLADAQACHFK